MLQNLGGKKTESRSLAIFHLAPCHEHSNKRESAAGMIAIFIFFLNTPQETEGY